MYYFHKRLTNNPIVLDKQSCLKSPVLLIIFDKADKTHKVFQEIKKVRPEKLYISCDGPRNNIIGDVLRVRDSRKIVEHVDWRCQVFTNFQINNFGIVD